MSPFVLLATLAAVAFNLPEVAGAVLGFGGWVLAHWQQLGEVIGLLVAMYLAIRNHQWDRLIKKAGELAYEVGLLTDLDNQQKRDLVAAELYALAGPLARKLFTPAQFSFAVEMGWKLIAKPALASGKEPETAPQEAA